MEGVFKTELDFPLIKRGKVRDIYEMEEHLLIVSTDRLSAYDVVFSQPIPKKGVILNKMSKFWFGKFKNIRNHIVWEKIKDVPEEVKERAVVCERAKPIKIEFIVRGYITGGGHREYLKKGTVSGIELPKGLKDGDELPEPILTPTTKEESGHDKPIGERECRRMIGNRFNEIKENAISIYEDAKEYCRKRGLILADTKMEFGIIKEETVLIDELLTCDSSRYWLLEEYENGKLENLDKQFVRDFVSKIGWNKKPPSPELPEEIIKKTSERYALALEMISGEKVLI